MVMESGPGTSPNVLLVVFNFQSPVKSGLARAGSAASAKIAKIAKDLFDMK
jgi:hypothetical protein